MRIRVWRQGVILVPTCVGSCLVSGRVCDVVWVVEVDSVVGS